MNISVLLFSSLSSILSLSIFFYKSYFKSFDDLLYSSINTLIFTITKHFVGDPNQYKEIALDVLINLRCPQLLDFRWYKDVFISKVLSRNDCQQSY